ncbi:MAG: PH domain-containing protein [Polyangiaceae bacterium]|nr:PH domain-containing protein [Polyangiaceae bacterium]
MYEPTRSLLLRVLCAPSEPPEAPLGSPGSTRVFRASPRLLTLRALQVALVGVLVLLPEVVGIAAALAAGHRGLALGLSVVLAALLLFTLGHWFVVRLDYDMRYYVVTDRSLRIREGALVIRESTFTFANVQNVSVQQGPIDRLLGISSVRIDTAGGGGGADKQQPFVTHRGVLAGIENAEEVRDRILQLLQAYRDAGLGDHDPSSQVSGGGLSAQALEHLREVRDEARELRRALESA